MLHDFYVNKFKAFSVDANSFSHLHHLSAIASAEDDPFRFYQTTFFIKQLHRVGLHLKNGLLLVCSKGLKQLL
jgi:hypothetical protein